MRRIVCDECKRLYDYDREEFCPRCGAFNPPVKVWDMDSQGNVVRVDGVNERTHTGSFVHREVHREKNVRKATGLDRPRAVKAPPPRPRQTHRPLQRSQTAQKQDVSDKLKAFFVILALILLFNLILPILFALL